MSSFDDNDWLKRMAEYEESSRKSKSESSSLILENNRRNAEQFALRRQLSNNNVEAEKYKALYNQMLAKYNKAVNDQKQFAADLQLPFKQLFDKRQELQGVKLQVEQLEGSLTSWIVRQKGAQDVAVEFGTRLGMTKNEVEKLILERSTDVIDNKLPIERENNLNQSKNSYLAEPNHQGIVSDYESRIASVKNRIKDML